jgi:hypothetical protein
LRIGYGSIPSETQACPGSPGVRIQQASDDCFGRGASASGRGIAAANLGKRREALAHLRRAEELGAAGPLLTETQAALKRRRPGRGIAERYSYTHYAEWVGQDAIEAVLKLIAREEKQERRDERAWTELLRATLNCPWSSAKCCTR